MIELVPQPHEETVILPGAVKAIDDILLGAGIGGTVEWVGFEEGQAVKAGQELFRIDQRSRQAQVEDAEAAYELAKKNRERIERLIESKVVSQDKYDAANTELLRAEAALKLARTQLSLSVVVAPVSGFADRIDVDRGEFANEGQTLAHLVKIDTVKLIVGTPERDVKAVAEQTQASVTIDALGKTFPGKIQHVSYAADPRTNTFDTTILIDNPNLVIRPGMVGRAEITVAKFDKAILIPLFCILQTLDGYVVFVEKDGVVHSRQVTLGYIRGDRVIALKGLEAGEHIVVVGQQDVADGQQVEVVPPTDPNVVVPVS
ncbi:MAG TPA: efflux RND transporter periplasmic adaptor subunit [bacterium]|nr:efflux RND transporter periplasmic adaptor subunit [bacterium]